MTISKSTLNVLINTRRSRRFVEGGVRGLVSMAGGQRVVILGSYGCEADQVERVRASIAGLAESLGITRIVVGLSP